MSCQSLGFECQCELCTADRADLSLTVEREAYVAEEKRKLLGHLRSKASARQPPDMRLVEDFVANVKSKYRDMKNLRVCMCDALCVQARFHFHGGEVAQAAETSMLVFELGKHVVEHVAMHHLLHAAQLHSQLGLQEHAERCMHLFREHFVGNGAYLRFICERNLPLIRNAIRMLALMK
jgi:hypothetical protein